MIDTHAHLNFDTFKKDYPEVIKKSFDEGLQGIVNIGSNFKTSLRAIEIAKEFKNNYAAVGLHPIHALDEVFDKEKYVSLIRATKGVVAVGETGLDYFRIKNENLKIKNLQKDIFIKHLEVAKELNLPVILHCRGTRENPEEAYLEMLDTLQSAISDKPYATKGVIHCFQSDWQIAQEFLKLGFYIGFTGLITFKNCQKWLLEVVEKAPIERILIETDCPFLAPEPYRGQRCLPYYVKFTALKIAEIKKMTFSQVISQTIENAKNLFHI